MKKVSIGLIQMKMAGEPSANLEKAAGMVSKAADKGADVVCLPELFSTRYFAQYKKSTEDYIETIPSTTTNVLAEVARENRVVLVGGSIYERDGKKLYNTSVVLGPDGKLLGKYRKVHVPHDENFYEQNYFSPGDSGYKVFNTKFGRLGVLICYDQWFPEAARINALMGAQIVFYPTAIGTVKGVQQAEGNWQAAWENVMRGHAIANGMVVAAVNRVGVEDRMSFWGGSFVCDAFGKTLTRGGRKEQVLVTQVDLEHGKNVREGWRFFYNRRPDSYKRLLGK